MSFFEMTQLNEELRNMYDEDLKVMVGETWERIILDQSDLNINVVIEGLNVQEAAHVCPVKIQANHNIITALKSFKKEKEKETMEKQEFIDVIIDAMQMSDEVILEEILGDFEKNRKSE